MRVYRFNCAQPLAHGAAADAFPVDEAAIGHVRFASGVAWELLQPVRLEVHRLLTDTTGMPMTTITMPVVLGRVARTLIDLERAAATMSYCV